MVAKFILSKEKVLEQYNLLKDLGVKVSYSFKTNREVGKVLEDESDCDFCIHSFWELEKIKDKSRIWFFCQAESSDDLRGILDKGVRNFVVDNEVDFHLLLRVVEKLGVKINLILRMKFQEHRVGSGKYFVYGLGSKRVNELILEIKDNKFIDKIGVHIHRKSQNTSEWEIVDELKDSLSLEVLERINLVNLGGGLPAKYRSYTSDVLGYIFKRIKESVDWLASHGIETYIEPGRFIAGPAVKLEAEIIQVYGNTVVINTTIYNCALDTVITGTKMLVEGEEDGDEYYLVKGNSPTRDDIFRYKVGLKNPKVGDKIVFLNAGAYNYTTDFFGDVKLGTEVV